MINRNTFYLHYESTDDVLRKIPLKQMIELAATLMEGGIKAFANRE